MNNIIFDIYNDINNESNVDLSNVSNDAGFPDESDDMNECIASNVNGLVDAGDAEVSEETGLICLCIIYIYILL